MDSLLMSINIVLPMFLLMVAGFALARWQLLPGDAVATLNRLVTRVALPCTLFIGSYNSDFRTAFNPALLFFCMAAVVFTFVLAFLLVPRVVKEDGRRAVVIHALFRGNTSIYGIPLAQGIVGAGVAVTDLLTVTSMTIILYNIFGVITLQTFSGKKQTVGSIVLGILKTPMLIGSLLGLAFSLLAVPLPNVLLSPVNSIASLTTPLAFLCLGASFRFSAAKHNLRCVTVVTLLRLLAMPLVWVTLGVLLFGFTGGAMAALLAVVATPTAVNTFPQAAAAGADGELAADIVLFTTVFSVLSLFGITFALGCMGMI